MQPSGYLARDDLLLGGLTPACAAVSQYAAVAKPVKFTAGARESLASEATFFLLFCFENSMQEKKITLQISTFGKNNNFDSTVLCRIPASTGCE